MKTKRMAERAGAMLLALAFALALIAPGISAADREAGPGEVLLLSDEIFGNSVEVTRPSDGNGNDKNRSGLDDETNPGAGDGRDNASNTGNDNPNNTMDPPD